MRKTSRWFSLGVIAVRASNRLALGIADKLRSFFFQLLPALIEPLNLGLRGVQRSVSFLKHFGG